MVTLDDITGAKYQRYLSQPFESRHNAAEAKRIGVWRWQSVGWNKDQILSVIMPHVDDGLVVDFGGALGPLGFGSQVVDLEPVDVWGRSTLQEMPEHYRAVFSSHCLEHLDAPWQMLASWIDGLPKRGWILLNLPSDKAYQFWHPKHKAAHQWLFTLDEKKHGKDQMLDIRQLLPKMDFAQCNYTGDDCIFVAARKGY